jgi:hypothetical protein
VAATAVVVVVAGVAVCVSVVRHFDC